MQSVAEDAELHKIIDKLQPAAASADIRLRYQYLGEAACPAAPDLSGISIYLVTTTSVAD
jgi:hypothetical protein